MKQKACKKSFHILIDADNFFASCEQAFSPQWRHKPLGVLTHNDGLIIARSARLKALGVKMGTPVWHIADLIKKHGIIIVSGNHELYDDMSMRMMGIIRQYFPHMEEYSIDEAFAYAVDRDPEKIYAQCMTLQRDIRRSIGINVSIGIAPTKTLAKIAADIAKHDKVDKVHRIDAGATDPNYPVEQIWGIGRQTTKKLLARGITDVGGLLSLSNNDVRRIGGANLLRTRYELLGVPALPPRTYQTQKTISHARSFGKPVTALSAVAAALSVYTVQACIRLRAQQTVAGKLQVRLTLTERQATNSTSPHPLYQHLSVTVPLPRPTNATQEIIAHALQALYKIYQPHRQYKKVGITLSDIAPTSAIQYTLFDTQKAGDGYSTRIYQTQKQHRIDTAIDHINAKYGKNLILPATALCSDSWYPKQAKRTPRYTTRWREVIRMDDTNVCSLLYNRHPVRYNLDRKLVPVLPLEHDANHPPATNRLCSPHPPSQKSP